MLMNELFENYYKFTLTSKLQSDSIEQRCSQYRQMADRWLSDGRLKSKNKIYLMHLLKVCMKEAAKE